MHGPMNDKHCMVTHTVICNYKFNHVTVDFPAINGIFKFTRIDYLTFLRGVIKAYHFKSNLTDEGNRARFRDFMFQQRNQHGKSIIYRHLALYKSLTYSKLSSKIIDTQSSGIQIIQKACVSNKIREGTQCGLRNCVRQMIIRCFPISMARGNFV